MNDKCWFPNGSETQKDKNFLIIQAPQSWIYVGLSNGELLTAKNGKTKVSCTCQTSGSCLPFTGSGPGGSTSGCAGSCTKCLMEQSVAPKFTKVLSGGYINLAIETRIIKIEEELPAAFDAMFEVPEVKNKIKSFIDRLYNGVDYPKVTEKNGVLKVPEGYLFAFVNICGRAAVIPVPESARISNGAFGSSASCSCTDGNCTAKSKSIPFIGSVTYCEGSCQGTCTLSTSKDKKLTYQAEFFKF